MPYIGNQHNVGDHVNNFKVLDDISSYTATFDGSATSVVSTSAETIRIPEIFFSNSLINSLSIKTCFRDN